MEPKNEHHFQFKVTPQDKWKLEDFRLNRIGAMERIVDYEMINSNQIMTVNRRGSVDLIDFFSGNLEKHWPN